MTTKNHKPYKPYIPNKFMEKHIPIKEENKQVSKPASSLTMIEITKEVRDKLINLKYEISAKNLTQVIKYLLFEADKYREEEK